MEASTHKIFLKTTVALGEKVERTMAGAICTALANLNWTITKARPNAQIQAVLETNPPYGITVEITTQKAGDFTLEFSAREATVNLQQVAADFTFELNDVVEKTLDIELQSTFNRALQKSDIQQLQKKETGIRSYLKWAFELFFTRHPMQPVAWIIALNIAVYISMLFAGAGFDDTDANIAINWGAASKALVVQGEYWRLLTACFIHYGFGHLMGNLIGLVLATNFLMLVLTRTQFLLGYLVTGVIAMSVSMWWFDESVSAGASGAIFGCYGILLGLILTPLLTKADRIAISVYMLFYCGFSLIYGLKDDTVDNPAHIGGLISGIPIGLIYYWVIKNNANGASYFTGVAAVALYGLVCSFFLLRNTTYYGFEFERLANSYDALERKAFNYYGNDTGTVEENRKLLNESLAVFDKALLVADSMLYIKGTPGYRITYALRLREYTEYRKLEMIANAKQQEGNIEWKDSVTYYQRKIDSLLKEFKEGD